MENSITGSLTGATATTKMEKITRSERSQSSPANMDRQFVHKLPEKSLNKQGRPIEQRELCMQDSNLEHLVPSSERVGAHSKKKEWQAGGVKMERQYGRRGDVGGIPPTVQSGESSSATTEQKNHQFSVQTELGGEAIVRGEASCARVATT
jgi:hypothetical protein